jgi:hypothetical protein
MSDSLDTLEIIRFESYYLHQSALKRRTRTPRITPRLVRSSASALLSVLIIVTAAVPASASPGTKLTATPLDRNCPWVDPAIMATRTSAKLATMTVAKMTIAQEVILLNFASDTNHSPQNIYFGAPRCVSRPSLSKMDQQESPWPTASPCLMTSPWVPPSTWPWSRPTVR